MKMNASAKWKFQCDTYSVHIRYAHWWKTYKIKMKWNCAFSFCFVTCPFWSASKMKHFVCLRENFHSKCSAQKQFEEGWKCDNTKTSFKLLEWIPRGRGKRSNTKQNKRKQNEKSITLITLTGFQNKHFIHIFVNGIFSVLNWLENVNTHSSLKNFYRRMRTPSTN